MSNQRNTMNLRSGQSGERLEGFELLRILCMLMIITLHFLDKGGILADTKAESWSSGQSFAWFLEAMCIVAVNCYVLISGFFAGRKPFNPSKLFRLWGIVLFYSIFIAAVSILFFPALVTDLTLYDMIKIICPVTTEHYWFASAYIMLFLVAPFLDMGIARISGGEFRLFLMLLIAVFSLSVSILPVISFPWDRDGYDMLWFMVVYLTGAYLSRFCQRFLYRKFRCMAFYLVSVSGIFLLTVSLRSIYLSTGKLGEIIDCGYSYNHILCLTGAIGLLGVFYSVNIRTAVIKKAVNFFARSSFGVYLIHEHMLVRYRWPSWTGAAADDFSWIRSWLISIFAVYIICALVDRFRSLMAEAFSQRLAGRGRH